MHKWTHQNSLPLTINFSQKFIEPSKGISYPVVDLYQVEANTEKQGMVIKGNGLFSRVTQCTGITARPDLTGICTIISQNSYFVLQSLLR